MVSVEGEAMRPVIWVTLEEVASGDWASPARRATSSHVLRCPVAGLTTASLQPMAVQIADEVAMPTLPRVARRNRCGPGRPRGHTFAVARQPRERSLTDL